MSICLLLSLSLCGVPQKPAIDPGEIERLIDVFLNNEKDKGAEALQVLCQHPQLARNAIDERLGDPVDAKLKERLQALRQRVLQVGLARTIYQRMQGGLTFSGQWADLAEYDPQVGQVLLALVKDPQVGVPIREGPFQNVRATAFQAIREGALQAISDLKLKDLLPELKALTTDILSEDWIIEGAGMAMAELGDRSWLDARIEALKKQLADNATDVPRRYAIYKLLSRYDYRTGRYVQALESYDATTAILEGRIAAMAGREARILRRVLWLTYYNSACSAAKGGKIDAAFEYLEKSLKADAGKEALEELASNLRDDGDLKDVRKDARYRDLADRLKRMAAGQLEKL
jgi:hypothetical protein